MKRALTCALALMIGTLFSANALAALGDQDQVKVGLHIIPKPAKGAFCSVITNQGWSCDSEAETSNLVVNTPGLNAAYWMYLILLDINTGPGVAGMALGIDYDAPSLYISSPTKCSDLEFADANWPDNPPAGITLTWDPGNNCQQTVDGSDPQGQGAALAYAWYVFPYADGTFNLIKRPGIAVPDFKIADCTSAESNPQYPEQAGYMGFGTSAGYQPCVSVVPVQESTWGQIKQQFGNGE